MTLNWASNQTQQTVWTWTDPPGLMRGIRKRFWAVKGTDTPTMWDGGGGESTAHCLTVWITFSTFMAAFSEKSLSTAAQQRWTWWRDISHRENIRHTRDEMKYVWSCCSEPAGSSLWLLSTLTNINMLKPSVDWLEPFKYLIAIFPAISSLQINI